MGSTDRAILRIGVYDHLGARQGFYVEKEIVGPFVECFKPVDVCSSADNLMLSLYAGKAAHSTETVKKVISLREGYAAQLAKIIADELVQAMSQNDTIDGYTKKEIGPPHD